MQEPISPTQEPKTHLFNCCTPPEGSEDNHCCYFWTVGFPSLAWSIVLPGCPSTWLLHQDESNFVAPISGKHSRGQVKSCCFLPCFNSRKCNEHHHQCGDGACGNGCACCFHWSVNIGAMGFVFSAFTWVPLIGAIIVALPAKKSLPEENFWVKSMLCPQLTIAQAMRERYANGTARWSLMMAGSDWASHVPTFAELVANKISRLSENDLRWLSRRVCWIIRRKSIDSKKSRMHSAFEVWNVHQLVCIFLPSASKEDEIVLDWGRSGVEAPSTCVRHCSCLY